MERLNTQKLISYWHKRLLTLDLTRKILMDVVVHPQATEEMINELIKLHREAYYDTERFFNDLVNELQDDYPNSTEIIKNLWSDYHSHCLEPPKVDRSELN